MWLCCQMAWPQCTASEQCCAAVIVISSMRQCRHWSRQHTSDSRRQSWQSPTVRSWNGLLSANASWQRGFYKPYTLLISTLIFILSFPSALCWLLSVECDESNLLASCYGMNATVTRWRLTTDALAVCSLSVGCRRVIRLVPQLLVLVMIVVRPIDCPSVTSRSSLLRHQLLMTRRFDQFLVLHSLTSFQLFIVV